jgi:tetratricopeptide (TPR) repeat protein
LKATKKWLFIRKFVLIFGFTIALLPQISAQNTQIETAEEEQIFRSGVELLNREKYTGAREAFEQYLEKVRFSPDKEALRTVDAEYYIAYCALNLLNPDAEILFQNFIAKYPWHANAAAANYELGYFFYNKKDYKKAIEYLEKANPSKLTKDQQTELSFIQGYSYLNLKEFEKSLEQFNKVKSGDNKYTYAASYYAGYLELKTGKYNEALSDLRTAEKNESYASVVPILEANVYYQMNAYDTLLTYAEKAITRKDIQEKEEMYLLMAEAYFKKENFTKAAEYFLNYGSKGNLNPPLKYRLGFAQYMSGKYQEAIENFKPLASSQDAMGQASSYYMALAYLKLGNKQYALAALQSASKAEFSKTVQEEALFNYAKVNADLDNINETILTLKQYNRLFPKSKNNEEADALLSEALLKTSNYTEAINYIESLKNTRSLRTNTAYQRVTFYKGTEEFNNKNFQKALQLFNKSTEFTYDKDVYLAANFWKGEVYSITKEYEDAINSYNKVIQNAQKDSEYFIKARYGIGYAYYHVEKYDKALEHFQAYVDALRDSKKYFYDDAVLRLGDLYAYNKKYDQAIKNYDEAIETRNPDLDYAYFRRGIVLSLQNKKEEALFSFDKVLEAFSGSIYSAEALYRKAELLHSKGEFQKAIPLFTKVINEQKATTFVPYSLNFRAIGYRNEGDDQKAIDDYIRIINDFPQHPVAQEALTGLQETLSNTDRSEEFSVWRNKFAESNPENTSMESIDYEAATSLYNNGKFDKSVAEFSNYISRYPESSNIPDARFYLGDSYFKNGEHEKAIEQFKTILIEKRSNYYKRAILRLAEINNTRNDFAKANSYYLQYLSNAESPRERLIAWSSLMENYYKLDKLDSVVIYARNILDHGKSSLDANRASLFLGKVAYKQGNTNAAIDNFLSTINLAKDENAAEAKYMIARIYYEQKKYNESLETLYELNNTYFSYDKWIGKSFLLIADNFISLEEIFQAKATLQSIIDKSPHAESREQAKKKLSELESKTRKEGED